MPGLPVTSDGTRLNGSATGGIVADMNGDMALEGKSREDEFKSLSTGQNGTMMIEKVVTGSVEPKGKEVVLEAPMMSKTINCD